LGLHARELTPLLVTRAIIVVAQTRAFKKAEIVMADSVGQPVSAKTLERITQDIGLELAERRDTAGHHTLVVAPESSTSATSPRFSTSFTP
jgi:hypothetical protein